MSTRVFTTTEVGRICHISGRTVRKMFDNGRLPGFRVPGSQDRRITQEGVAKLLRERELPAEWLTDYVAELDRQDKAIAAMIDAACKPKESTP